VGACDSVGDENGGGSNGSSSGSTQGGDSSSSTGGSNTAATDPRLFSAVLRSVHEVDPSLYRALVRHPMVLGAAAQPATGQRGAAGTRESASASSDGGSFETSAMSTPSKSATYTTKPAVANAMLRGEAGREAFTPKQWRRDFVVFLRHAVSTKSTQVRAQGHSIHVSPLCVCRQSVVDTVSCVPRLCRECFSR